MQGGVAGASLQSYQLSATNPVEVSRYMFGGFSAVKCVE